MVSSRNIVQEDKSTGVRGMPIFPLNLVLFPGSSIQLKIFEQRYQDMTKACLRDETPFGVCRIRAGREVGAPAEHESIGCSARISHWEMPHPGLYQLNCVGESVFRLADSHIEDNGLIRGVVEWMTDGSGTVDAQTFNTCRNALQRFADHAGKHFVTGPPAFDDPAWVSYKLAEILPVDLQTKQDLLEQRNTALRVSRIATLLQSA